MENLAPSLFKAMRSLFAPGMVGVFVKSIFITIVALGVLILVSGWLAAFLSHSFEIAILSAIGGSVLAWFLFPGIMPVIISFFDQEIVGLIEAQDYPNLPPMRMPEFWGELAHDIRFSAGAILLNILVLPLYIIIPLIPFIFYALNGHLLGKEFFISVARRRVPLEEAHRLRRRHSLVIWVSGILITVAATIPLINFVAPFWGIAMMTHLFHRVAEPQNGASQAKILL